MEIYVEDVLIMSFPHDDAETGNTYITYNVAPDTLEYYSGGTLARSYHS